MKAREVRDKRKKPKAKRTKERTIADIINKVSTWRNLYNGKPID